VELLQRDTDHVESQVWIFNTDSVIQTRGKNQMWIFNTDAVIQTRGKNQIEGASCNQKTVSHSQGWAKVYSGEQLW
jgi:hypothetical protein